METPGGSLHSSLLLIPSLVRAKIGSQDPIGLVNDLALYRYVLNAPIYQTDPSGLAPPLMQIGRGLYKTIADPKDIEALYKPSGPPKHRSQRTGGNDPIIHSFLFLGVRKQP